MQPPFSYAKLFSSARARSVGNTETLQLYTGHKGLVLQAESRRGYSVNQGEIHLLTRTKVTNQSLKGNSAALGKKIDFEKFPHSTMQ